MTDSEILDDVARTYADSRTLAEDLAKQRRLVEMTVREARMEGFTWSSIARAAGVTEQAVMKAAKRRPNRKET